MSGSVLAWAPARSWDVARQRVMVVWKKNTVGIRWSEQRCVPTEGLQGAECEFAVFPRGCPGGFITICNGAPPHSLIDLNLQDTPSVTAAMKCNG